jgi:hypothetical protein
MNTKTLKQTFVIAFALMITFTVGSSVAFGQDKADGQLSAAPKDKDDQDNTLEGTWQSVVTPRDCVTGAPAPFSFKALTTFMQGGTMSEDSSSDMDGPWRTSGHGVWQHTTGKKYTVAWVFYHWAPNNGPLLGTVKVRVNKTLGHDANSLTGDGTIEVSDPNGNVVFTGCSNETATRFTL